MKRILVVDDIAENRYLLEAILQAYGLKSRRPTTARKR